MRPSSRNEFTIAIICALTIEADAVEALFDDTYDKLGEFYGKQLGDANSYINGRIGKHNVVLCCMPRTGKSGAASVASSLRVSYPAVHLVLVVGICGGVPYPSSGQQIFLGDVIISDSLVEYDFGKQYPGEFQQKAKEALRKPDREIRTLLAGFKTERLRNEFHGQMSRHLHSIQQSDSRWQHPSWRSRFHYPHDVLFPASYHHKHYGQSHLMKRCPCFFDDSSQITCEESLQEDCSSLGCNENNVVRHRQNATGVSVHIGTVGSADTVMKSGEHRDRLAEKDDIIGFEMEGAGVWDNISSCIIIKGVSDYADSHKSKKWQEYAAATGASAAKAVLEYWRPIAKGHWMVPFSRNPDFTGRQDEINQLEDSISTQNGPRKLAISGLGGVGKTQIALELAYRQQQRHPEYSIFWITCTSEESIEQSYASICVMLGQNIKPAEAKEHVKAYFSNQAAGSWLLIFDSADDMNFIAALKDALPRSELGHIIFTTRNRQLALELASSNVISVSEPDERTGIKMLEKLIIQKHLLDDRDTNIALLKQLTYLPLAITQAARYINGTYPFVTLSGYLKLLQEQESDVVELLSTDFGDYSDTPNPVASTWLISFQQIRKLNPSAADYLFLMSCVDASNIPQSFLPPMALKKMTDALGLLGAYSFVTIQAQKDLSLHRLVRLATRNWMRQNQLFAVYIGKAADRFQVIFPDNDHANRKLWREYLPHVLSLKREKEFMDDQYTGLLQHAAQCLYSDGRFDEAHDILKSLTNTLRKKSGDRDPAYLTTLAWMANTYRSQGRWKEAEALGLQVMVAREQVLEQELEHHHTLTSMDNLATIYRHLGRWKEAEDLHVRAMKTCQKLLGPEHPLTLTTMSNLASTYGKQGRWMEEEELNKRVVDARVRVLGPEHPSTLISIANLALTNRSQGRWKEAERLLLQAMNIQRQDHVLGPEHPDTLNSMSNLALTYEDQGRLEEAEKLGQEVTKIQQRILGPEHPYTLMTTANLALCYVLQGRWSEAEDLDMQVMKIRERVLGPEHPDTLVSMNNLAVTYMHQARWKQAENMQAQLMTIQEQLLGPDHPHTLGTMQNLAFSWRSLGKRDAMDLMSQCFERRRKTLGPNHPDTLSSSLALSHWQREDNSSSMHNSLQGSQRTERDPDARQISKEYIVASGSTFDSSNSGTSSTRRRKVIPKGLFSKLLKF